MTVEYYKQKKGHPLPIGVTLETNGVNFALVSKHATAVTLVLYDLAKNRIAAEIPLDPHDHKTGDVWHIFVETDKAKSLGYAYKLEGPTQDPLLHYFNPLKSLLDPYARAVNTPTQWGSLCCGDQESYHPIGLVSPPIDFDWENDQPLHLPPQDLIIYEMHVRGFTQDSSSQVKAPGTFLGLIEKIPHLLELGINAVELLPIQEFNECEYRLQNPLVRETLYQYWGYSTVNFFAPMNRYGVSQLPGDIITEFKALVKALHKNGIVVILDIVLNHTHEGNEEGPINSFKGIDNCTYYMLDTQGSYLNYTGVGNTINANYPITQQFILDVLRYWVVEMHVDGFRFDLASIFSRSPSGEVLNRAPLIESISHDPILSNTILIAEPWDAAGLYQVGSFYPYEKRWNEWNALYRDDIRRFIKGTPNVKHRVASRLSGSQDIYGSLSPTCSINFIVAHDGFTLHDLVSYDQKHNLANGENNRDGLNDNDSWNCGKEGMTEDPAVIKLRQRQMRNFHLALMLSQGIPMLLMGDEYAHTKKGNNNTWCHDNELNWFLWDKLEENKDFYRYYRKLIDFRKHNPILHRDRFLTDNDVSWWDKNGDRAHWDKDTHFLAFTLHELEKGIDLYAAFNAQNESIRVVLPTLNEQQKWSFIVNTAHEPPADFFDQGQEVPIEGNQYTMIPFSALLLKKSI